ncbi:hypothetical protein Chor_017279, partial [Crotalus horridus]
FVAPLQNIVTRITNLPLVSSAYGVWSSVYEYAKKTYPCVNTACNIVEMVAAVAVGSARGGAQPLLPHLEPQIATVFEDGVTLTKSVVSSTVQAAGEAKGRVTQKVTAAVGLTKDIVQDGITLTKSVVNSTVSTARSAASGAKGLMTHRAADVVKLGKQTLNEGVDLTRSVVSTTVNAARQMQSSGVVQEGVEMATLFRQAVASGVDTVLDKTEQMLATEVHGVSQAAIDQQQREQSYFVRLGSLSSKLRSRVYRHSLNRLHVAQVKNSAGSHFQEAQQKLNQTLLKWTQIQPEEDQERRKKENTPEQIRGSHLKVTEIEKDCHRHYGGPGTRVEPLTLAMLRSLIQNLSPAYTWLMSTVEVLPRNLRERVDQTQSNFQQLHRSFSSAESFQDLPSGLLTQSQEMISQAREVLHTLAEHLIQITPLNWIVGPFRSQAGGSGTTQEVQLKETSKEARAPSLEKVAAKRAKRMEKTTEEDPRESTEAMGALKELLAGSEKAPQEKN